MRSDVVGRVFRIETAGAVDGPGLRMVLFLQGCPLRCPYCHNPEGWPMEGGEAVTVDEIVARFSRYRGYYRNGGVTLSGGEPLAQAGFARALIERCAAEGIHTALDTSGCIAGGAADAAIDAADLLLLDIKFPDQAMHMELLGFRLDSVLGILRRRETLGKDVWVRHVVVPGLTDTEESVDSLAALVSPFSCVKKVELLPFRTLCLEKYGSLGIRFPLEGTPDAEAEFIARLSARIARGA